MTLPGTHDSAASVSKYLGGSRCLKGFVLCQDKSITEQLNQGIRTLDLRISGMEDKESGEVSYWTGHSFRLQNLSNIVEEIKAFLSQHPTEFIFLLVKADWSPMNDVRCLCFGGCSMKCCGRS